VCEIPRLSSPVAGLMSADIRKRTHRRRSSGLRLSQGLERARIGGAWVPAFVLPRWLQNVSLYAPTRWAIGGLDGATWRGLPFSSAVLTIIVLVGSAAVCLAVAIWRFRWQE
jgi:ABC-2 type transport system permease protein